MTHYSHSLFWWHTIPTLSSDDTLFPLYTIPTLSGDDSLKHPWTQSLITKGSEVHKIPDPQAVRNSLNPPYDLDHETFCDGRFSG